MMCKKPYRQGVAEYGCGQCMPCRINRRNLWTSRVLLEARMHAWSFFVTLTYAEENLPADGSVSPRDLMLFLKRLRAICPERIRFYAVGEYGGKVGRPHYHLSLFGLTDPCHIGPATARLYAHGPCMCVVCRAWGKGGVDIRELAQETAAYIMSFHTEPKDGWGGRRPGFARMSLRPGIGALAVPVIEKALTTDAGARSLLGNGDVPHVVRWEKRMRPLGRYLRRKIREELGMDPGMPEAARAALSMRMQQELLVQGARQKRESKREAVAARAEGLESIQRSKKGNNL